MGATGLVGQQFVRLLENHPYFEVVALTASKKSEGKKYCKVTDWFLKTKVPNYIADTTVTATSLETIQKKDVEIVFSALPSHISNEIEISLAKENISVFSNANAHRMKYNVPILIPEVNPDHLNMVKFQNFNHKGFIVTNSNCSTSGLVIGLKPLMKYRIKNVIITTYQALSGAGKQGVVSMDILNNIIPYIKDEEEKIERETKKILGERKGDKIEAAEFNVNASCARVPVKNGHLESIVIELEEEIDVKEVLNDFKNFTNEPQALELPTAPKNPIIIVTDQNRPQPARDLNILNNEEEQGMVVTIGRVRKKENCLNFFLLVHNTIRGAAGASVLNAEFAYAKNFLN